MNHHNIMLGEANRMAKSMGAKFYYDSMLRLPYRHGEAESRTCLSYRYYFKTKDYDAHAQLEEIAHYSQNMAVFTEITRKHSMTFVNSGDYTRPSTELKVLDT